MDAHDIELREDGTFWCNTEDVPTEDCTDYDRCAHGCCCNDDDNEDS